MNEELRNDIVTEENENAQEVVNEEVEVVETEEVNEETEVVEEVSTLSKVITWTKRILSWLGTAILAILFIVVGWISIDKFIIGNPVPSFMGYSVLNIADVKFKDVAVPCLLFISNLVYVYALFFSPLMRLARGISVLLFFFLRKSDFGFIYPFHFKISISLISKRKFKKKSLPSYIRVKNITLHTKKYKTL